ncbi:MAG: YlbF family regulator [Clostridia bacterium]|nr:YlbF family regulator [Clostridia bacterium]
MGIIEATRNLGVEIQKDERFIAFIKAKLANDNDAELQNKIGEFNTTRMNLDREMNAETQDENKIKELNEQLREIYTAVMSSKSMLDYNTAKAGLDAMLNDINSIIMQCVEGEDPLTAEPQSACTGSCSTCGGCH